MKIIIQNKNIFVDDEDYPKIKNFSWMVKSAKYPQATINGKRYLMHHYIFLINGVNYQNKITDHINGNGYDNRKSNLRFVTHTQNIVNSKKQDDTSSKYKGVCFEKYSKRIKRWRAYCQINGKCTIIGRFHTEKEAGLKYNEKAKELWGEYAKLNKIEE